ncbi:MAG TPA: hypothetical protein VH702_21195 [Vicinamibacterales bacterium]
MAFSYSVFDHCAHEKVLTVRASGSAERPAPAAARLKKSGGSFMLAKKNGMAFVVVQKTWFDHAMKGLTGHESGSLINAHVIQAPLDDVTDHRGLWLQDVKSRWVKKTDGSVVIMRLMIPWQFVLAVGLTDEPAKMPTGFTSDNVTDLTASDD